MQTLTGNEIQQSNRVVHTFVQIQLHMYISYLICFADVWYINTVTVF